MRSATASTSSSRQGHLRGGHDAGRALARGRPAGGRWPPGSAAPRRRSLRSRAGAWWRSRSPAGWPRTGCWWPTTSRASTTCALLLAAACLVLVVVAWRSCSGRTSACSVAAGSEAHTDALTGLRNRRSLMSDLELELALASAAEPVPASSSTSTASRSTTTPSAIWPATGCWRAWARGWPTPCTATGAPTGWAGTSSACSCGPGAAGVEP